MLLKEDKKWGVPFSVCVCACELEKLANTYTHIIGSSPFLSEIFLSPFFPFVSQWKSFLFGRRKTYWMVKLCGCCARNALFKAECAAVQRSENNFVRQGRKIIKQKRRGNTDSAARQSWHIHYRRNRRISSSMLEPVTFNQLEICIGKFLDDLQEVANNNTSYDKLSLCNPLWKNGTLSMPVFVWKGALQRQQQPAHSASIMH